MTQRDGVTARRKIGDAVSALEPRIAHLGSSLAVEYDKRLMVISGRANPALAGRIAEKLGVTLGGVTLRTFSNGEVYCRFEESIRGADVFLVQPTCGNPETGVTANDSLMELLLMVDARPGLRAPRDRRHPVVRLLAAGQEVARPRADLRPPRRPHARDRGRRSRAHHGPARGQIQGFFSSPWTT